MNKPATHVVMAGDRNILPGMAVAGRSALEHATGPLSLEILGTAFTPADKSKLIASWQHPNMVAINFHEITMDDTSQYRSTMYLKSKAAYSRYFIGRIKGVSRLVYIDTDIIVLRDLTEAGSIDLNGRSVAAVRDISVRLNPDQPRITNVLGIKNSADYFNSGFLVIDMERWAELGAENKLCDLSVSMFDRLDCQDQDALNIVFEGDVKILDTTWNTSQYEAEENVDGVILHLIGTIKPWHPDYSYHFRKLFNHWIDKTAYCGLRPSNPTSLSARVTRLMRRIPTADMLLRKAGVKPRQIRD